MSALTPGIFRKARRSPITNTNGMEFMRIHTKEKVMKLKHLELFVSAQGVVRR